MLSRTAVSQVTEQLWQEYEAFAGRDHSEFSVSKLFVDGVAERLRAGLPREAVLCARGITDDDQKVPLHLAPSPKEDMASCTAFRLRNLRSKAPRKLRPDVRAGAAGGGAVFQ